MINHMVSDPVRAISSAKKKTTKVKYENTYLEDFENWYHMEAIRQHMRLGWKKS